jgi:hypothetical protein
MLVGRCFPGFPATDYKRQKSRKLRRYPDFILRRSQQRPYVALRKENHMQLTEVATLDGKSGAVEGSGLQPTFLGNVFVAEEAQLCS